MKAKLARMAFFGIIAITQAVTIASCSTKGRNTRVEANLRALAGRSADAVATVTYERAAYPPLTMVLHSRPPRSRLESNDSRLESEGTATIVATEDAGFVCSDVRSECREVDAETWKNDNG